MGLAWYDAYMTNPTVTITTKYTIETITIHPGDKIKSFRGEDWTFIEVTRAPEPGRSGKVLVEDENGTQMEFYHTVFPGLVIS